MKKYLFLVLTIWALTGCSKYVSQIEPYRWADHVKVVSGPYQGAEADIEVQIDDKYKGNCKIHQYHAKVTKNYLKDAVWLCHEDLAVEKAMGF